MTTLRKKLPVLLLIIFCFGLLAPGCQKFSRAFDKGGTIFTVEIETDAANRGEITERAIQIIEGKLDSIRAEGEVKAVPDKDNQIYVIIYRADNPEKLKKFLFSSYRLELKKAVSPMYPMLLETYPTEDAARRIATKDQEVLPYPDEEDASIPQFVIVEKRAVITGEDVMDAEADSRSGSEYDNSIYFSLNPTGAAKLGDWTSKNINNYIAVILNKEVKSVAYIRSQITDNGVIDGRFTREEAENIALSLKSGYLPATLKIIEEKTFQGN